MTGGDLDPRLSTSLPVDLGNAVHLFVVVAGRMMIENETANASLTADFERVIGRGMAVMRKACVLFRQKLRVVDHCVDAFERGDDAAPQLAENFAILLGGRL